MFPLEYPLRMLQNAPPISRVLDPFCGRGTTLYAARTLGLSAYGIDTNPVAVAIAQAKLARTTVQAVTNLAAALLEGPSPTNIPQGEFWSLCYHPATLSAICKLREELQRRRGNAAIVLRALMLGILHGPLQRTFPSYLSNQMPRTFASKPEYSVRYWRKYHFTAPPQIDILELITRKAQRVLTALPAAVPGNVQCADARNLTFDEPFDYVITSPPYYGMLTYRADQWLRYWFLGAPPEVPYHDRTQVSRGGVRGFIQALANIWDRIGAVSHEDTQLCVRFGSLPSEPVDPEQVLRTSFEQSTYQWVIQDLTPALQLRRGTRQAEQMGTHGRRNPAHNEIDVIAQLNQR